jgi:hypothetical protein
MRRWKAVILISVILYGCTGFGRETADETISPFPHEEGRKNLAAIVEILSARGQRLERGSPPPQETIAPVRNEAVDLSFQSVEPMVALPFRDGLQSPVQPMKKRFEKKPALRRSTNPSNQDPHAWPIVPPYTVFAPAGSAYPGSVRCMPDYLGGQRCHTVP